MCETKSCLCQHSGHQNLASATIASQKASQQPETKSDFCQVCSPNAWTSHQLLQSKLSSWAYKCHGYNWCKVEENYRKKLKGEIKHKSDLWVCPTFKELVEGEFGIIAYSNLISYCVWQCYFIYGNLASLKSCLILKNVMYEYVHTHNDHICVITLRMEEGEKEKQI